MRDARAQGCEKYKVTMSLRCARAQGIEGMRDARGVRAQGCEGYKGMRDASHMVKHSPPNISSLHCDQDIKMF